MPKLVQSLVQHRLAFTGATLVALCSALAIGHTTTDTGLSAEDTTAEFVRQEAAALGIGSKWLSGDYLLDFVEPDDGEGGSEDEIAAMVARLDALPGVSVSTAGFYSEGEHLYRLSASPSRWDEIDDDLIGHELLEVVEPEIYYALPDSAFAAADPEAQRPDRERRVVNDPMFKLQWHMEQINAPQAWVTQAGKGAVVAVIDTGVAYKDAHGVKGLPDLAGTHFTKGESFISGLPEGLDDHAHGSHVAGTIAQTTNNGVGVTGVAYESTIMPLKVLSADGRGSVPGIANAIRYAADNGAHVINMSLGGPLPSLVMKRAIDYAHKKGVTIVAAAGNSGRRSASYPASYNHVISVAATQYDKTTTFYSQWHSTVDIAAPGGNTRVDQNNDGRPDGVLQQTLKEGRLDEHDFLLYMGTSMASPHVAAGAAMVISQGITHPDKVEAILKKTADSSQSKRFSNKGEYKERYGAGIMQVDKTVKAAAGGQGGLRLVFSTFFALMALGMVRRRDPMGTSFEHGKTVVGVAAASGAGLFFLPWLFGDSAMMGALAHPLAEMDMLVMGLGWHQSPITASVLLPVLGYGLLGGSTKGRAVACGLALGMAGFLVSESLLLTSDVRWVPGVGALDRVWLAGNGVLSLALGYFGLKRY